MVLTDSFTMVHVLNDSSYQILYTIYISSISYFDKSAIYGNETLYELCSQQKIISSGQ